jgi:hypothetical protein
MDDLDALEKMLVEAGADSVGDVRKNTVWW